MNTKINSSNWNLLIWSLVILEIFFNIIGFLCLLSIWFDYYALLFESFFPLTLKNISICHNHRSFAMLLIIEISLIFKYVWFIDFSIPLWCAIDELYNNLWITLLSWLLNYQSCTIETTSIEFPKYSQASMIAFIFNSTNSLRNSIDSFSKVFNIQLLTIYVEVYLFLDKWAILEKSWLKWGFFNSEWCIRFLLYFNLNSLFFLFSFTHLAYPIINDLKFIWDSCFLIQYFVLNKLFHLIDRIIHNMLEIL